jgi:uncharacterized protein YidB (DUF937 family)
MSLFDIAKSLMSGGDTAQIFTQVSELVNQNGGVNGLLEKFKTGGMTDAVTSWIGNGQNLPITKEQIEQALGSDTVKQIASKMGLDPEKTAGQLATVIPQLVDKLTPNGQVPAGGISKEQLLALGADFLKSKLH